MKRKLTILLLTCIFVITLAAPAFAYSFNYLDRQSHYLDNANKYDVGETHKDITTTPTTITTQSPTVFNYGSSNVYLWNSGYYVITNKVNDYDYYYDSQNRTGVGYWINGTYYFTGWK